MKFDDLDTMMRVYETSTDHCVLPGMYIVIRLDGKGFTKMTKNLGFEKPFDDRFHDMMVSITQNLVEHTGFSFLYGYTESDEISLLLAPEDITFGRKERKLISVLAGYASAFATEYMVTSSNIDRGILVFDARVSQLPTKQKVVDYFRWRHQDSYRNALNGYCHWKLVQSGKTSRQATKILEGKGASFKNELLFTEFNINFNDTPRWHRRGSGVYWKSVERKGVNPLTGEEVPCTRRVLVCDHELLMGDEYSDFIRGFLDE